MALEIPPLPDMTILLVEVGSTAHGTGIPGGEDHDELGVVVESSEQVLGLDERGFDTVMQRTQPEGSPSGPGDIDRTLHSLRRFVRLAAKGNPSILMSFWAPVEYSTAEGESLRDLGTAFIGRHMIPRYRGYMQSQANKLLAGRSGRSGGDPSTSPADRFNTKHAMHCARLGFQCIELLTTGGLRLPIEGDVADWLRDVRHGRVSFDDWWERTLMLDAELESLMSDRSLPPEADRARITEWVISTHRSMWGRED